jgi:hypothetical protein
VDNTARSADDFEAFLERSITPAGLIDQMTAAYLDLANLYRLWVAARDLLGGRAWLRASC